MLRKRLSKSEHLRAASSEMSFEIFNIAAAYAVYEAVVLQKPFYERVVTVAGECVIEPKNIWAVVSAASIESVQAR